MKKIIIAILFFPAFIHAQDIPKFSNTIIVKGTCFDSAKSSLLDRGFFIDQQSKEDGTIITKAKGVDKNEMHQLIIMVRVKDSSAIVTGKWNLNMNYHAERGGLFSNDKTNFTQLEYWRSKSSVPHFIFLIMNDYATSLHGQVAYEKK